jgi:hypothetical protein
LRSRRELLLENLALRQQLATFVQARRPLIGPADRAFWVVLRPVWERRADVVVIVKPETVIAGTGPASGSTGGGSPVEGNGGSHL